METKKYKTPDTDALFVAAKKICDEFIVNGQWYEWYDDGCPYDNSGKTRPLTIAKRDYITGLDVHEQLCLLDYLYTGRSRASYVSGCGIFHETLKMKVEEEIDNFANGEIIKLNIPANIKENSKEYLELFDDILESDDCEWLDVIGKIQQHYTKDTVLALLPKRVYVDMSVFYGAPAKEFSQDSKIFWDAVRNGGIVLIVSDVLDAELRRAPAYVQGLFDLLPESQIEQVVSTDVSDKLAAEYIAQNVVGESSLDDCKHIALATITRADALVSWNFKHIVNRRDGYNDVNNALGYPKIKIQSPNQKEIQHDETSN